VNLSDRLADPLNRAVRYPLARAMAPFVLKTPIQADHITFTHLALGIGAAVLVARGTTGILPWAMLEARMVLDCLDGVIARARNTCSPRGRAKDELADAAGFLALVIAIAIRTHAWALGEAVLCIAALMAAGYAVLKRRLQGMPLDMSPDDPLLVITRFADAQATKIFWPAPRRAEPRYVAAVSLLSWDNALPIIHLGVLTGALVGSELAALAYGAFAVALVLALGRLASVRRPAS
jgi:phosphatidylglycerophosphate synthase